VDQKTISFIKKYAGIFASERKLFQLKEDVIQQTFLSVMESKKSLQIIEDKDADHALRVHVVFRRAKDSLRILLNDSMHRNGTFKKDLISIEGISFEDSNHEARMERNQLKIDFNNLFKKTPHYNERTYKLLVENILNGVSKKDLANKNGLTLGRVSQLVNEACDFMAMEYKRENESI